MALFDKIGEMAKNVGDKTGDMIEVSKLNSQVSEADKRILEKKREIGEFCWGQYIANIQLDPEVAKLCAAIKEDEALIARMQADIRSIKADKAAAPVVVEAGLLRCQKCGEPNPEGTRFCQACGVRLEVPEPAPPVMLATCLDCGFQNPAGTGFCQACGRDMDAAQMVSGLPEAETPSVEEEPAGKICRNCGAVNSGDNRFCRECGSTLDELEPPVPA